MFEEYKKLRRSLDAVTSEASIEASNAAENAFEHFNWYVDAFLGARPPADNGKASGHLHRPLLVVVLCMLHLGYLRFLAVGSLDKSISLEMTDLAKSITDGFQDVATAINDLPGRGE